MITEKVKAKIESMKEKIEVPAIYHWDDSKSFDEKRFCAEVILPLFEEAGIECRLEGSSYRIELYIDGIKVFSNIRNCLSESIKFFNDLGQSYSGNPEMEKENRYYIKGKKSLKKKTIINNILKLVETQREKDTKENSRDFIIAFMKESIIDIQEKCIEILATKVIVREMVQAGGYCAVNIFPNQEDEYVSVKHDTYFSFKLNGDFRYLKIQESLQGKDKVKLFVMESMSFYSSIDKISKLIKETYTEKLKVYTKKNPKAMEFIVEHLKINEDEK